MIENNEKFICDIIADAQKKEYFIEFFKDSNGYFISAENKKELNKQTKSLTYGDVSYDSLTAMLDIINPTNPCVFYDLGSGIGKALVGSVLASPIKTIKGIEALPKLCDESISIIKKFISFLGEKFQDIKLPTYEVYNQNIEDFNFSDADIVFVNSTCFEADLMHEISRKSEQLKKDSYCITFTKKIDSKLFEVVHEDHFEMEWGNPTVYIQKKIA